MSEHDLKGRAASRLISTQPTGGATDLAASGPPAERDPIDRVSSRLGDASCANAHASALDLPHRMERSSTHSALLRLQRRYGNRFVGQVLDRARDEGPSEGRLELVERSIEQARGGGLGLDHRTQGQMESAFGADFSGVRIHTDSRADSLNHSLSARAFATGRDVFFRQGEYDPGSSGGRELLAHELTHVVQQTGDGIQRKVTVSEPDDPHEVEADQMARAVVQQEHDDSTSVDRMPVARQEDDKDASTKLMDTAIQRQPEAPAADEEDEKKKLHRRADATVLSRQEDEQALVAAVSSPHDAGLDVDRAANLVVRGKAAPGPGGAMVAARKTIQRDEEMTEDEYVGKRVESAEADVKKAINSTQVSVGATFSISGNHKKELTDKIALVEDWTKAMDEQGQMKVGSAINESGPGSDITPDKIGDNVQAAVVLKKYAAALDNEGGDLTAIQNQHAVVQVDYTRALASINAAAALYSIDITKSKGDGAKAANQMADTMGVDSKKSDQPAVKNKEAVSLLTGKANAYNTSIGKLKSHSLEVKAQVAAMKGATARFRIHTMAKEIKEKTTELNAAKQEEAAIKGVVSSVSSTALAACGAESLVAFSVPTPTLEGAGKQAKDLASKGAKSLFDDAKENLIDAPITKAIADLTGLTQKINNLKTALGKLDKETEAQGDIAAAADVEKQQFLLAKSLNDYNVERKNAENLKAQLRDEWQKLGKAMDTAAGGGEKYTLLTKTVGECDAFFGQAQKVYDTIKGWENTRTQTKDMKGAINADTKTKSGIEMGLKAWEFILADPGKRIYGIVEHPIMLQSGSGINVNEGQNPIEQCKVIKNDLRVLGKTLMDYRNSVVQNALGVNVPYPEVSFLQAEEEAK